jgi:hypothetical protein
MILRTPYIYLKILSVLRVKPPETHHHHVVVNGLAWGIKFKSNLPLRIVLPDRSVCLCRLVRQVAWDLRTTTDLLDCIVTELKLNWNNWNFCLSIRDTVHTELHWWFPFWRKLSSFGTSVRPYIQISISWEVLEFENHFKILSFFLVFFKKKMKKKNMTASTSYFVLTDGSPAYIALLYCIVLYCISTLHCIATDWTR